jgi:hypothetical protein
MEATPNAVCDMEAKPTQYAMIMEAKPTQYAMIMEAKPTQYAASPSRRSRASESFEAEQSIRVLRGGAEHPSPYTRMGRAGS